MSEAEETAEGTEATARPSAARQSLYYLLGAALQGTGALLVQPFSIRILSPTEWGQVGVALVLLQVGQVILSAGLPLAVSRAYFDPLNGASKARAIHGANAILSIALAVVIALACVVTASAQPSMIALAWAIAATGFLSVVVSSQAILRSQHRAPSFVALSGCASLGANIGGLLGVLIGGPSATSYLSAFAVVMMVTAVISLVLAKPTLPSREREAVKSAFRIGLPVLPHSIAIMMLLQGDTFLVQHFQNAASVGRYVSAAAFALGPFAILSGLNNVWTTRIFEAAHRPHLRESVRKVAREAALVAAVVSLCGTSAATIGMLVLKGPDHDAAQLAKVLPAVAVGYALYLVGMSTLFGLGRTGALTWATPLVVVLGATLAWEPAQSSRFWELGSVRVIVFLILGALYAALARGQVKGAIPLGGFAAVFAVVGIAIAINLLLPTTIAVGTATLVAGVGVAATGLWALRRRALAS